MCSSITVDFGYDNSTIILNGDVYCRVSLACTKVLFNLSSEAIINVRNECLGARCAIFLLEVKQVLFFCRLAKGFTFLKRIQNQFKLVFEDVCCPGKYCCNREECESLNGYVKFLRSIYAWRKCGAWLFAHKVLFMLQEHVQTTKTDKTRFFFVKKSGTWYPTNYC